MLPIFLNACVLFPREPASCNRPPHFIICRNHGNQGTCQAALGRGAGGELYHVRCVAGEGAADGVVPLVPRSVLALCEAGNENTQHVPETEQCIYAFGAKNLI